MMTTEKNTKDSETLSALQERNKRLARELRSIKQQYLKSQKLTLKATAQMQRLERDRDQQQAMNRAKNKYLVECNIFDDFFDWYSKNYADEEFF